MSKTLHQHIEADHENRRYTCTEPLCDAIFRGPSEIPLHVVRQYGRKDIIILPAHYGLELSELATGMTLPLAEAQAYGEVGPQSNQAARRAPSKDVDLQGRNRLRGKP
jgi:hypothetical protein